MRNNVHVPKMEVNNFQGNMFLLKYGNGSGQNYWDSTNCGLDARARAEEVYALNSVKFIIHIFIIIVQQNMGRLRGLTGSALDRTDRYHLSSNLSMGTYGGCFITEFASLPLGVAPPIQSIMYTKKINQYCVETYASNNVHFSFLFRIFMQSCIILEIQVNDTHAYTRRHVHAQTHANTHCLCERLRFVLSFCVSFLL